MMTGYNTVVIDPPWEMNMSNGATKTRPNRRTELPYGTMTIEEIKAFPLKDYANDGAHIYCWTVNKWLHETFHVLEAWGVSFYLAMPMVKASGIAPAMDYIFGSEFCLLGFFGRPRQNFTGVGKLNWFKTNPKAGDHSRKPRDFYSVVEQMSPAPRIDIFSRQRRHNWDSWGNEVPEIIPTLEVYQQEERS